MDNAKRNELWESYFNAEYRHRLFAAKKDELAKRARLISFGVAVGSCGPLVGVAADAGLWSLVTLLGIVAAILGIYLTSSQLLASLSAAKHATIAWGQAASQLSKLWARCESGEDVWEEYVALDHGLNWIDAITIDRLEADRDLEWQAYADAELALAPH